MRAPDDNDHDGDDGDDDDEDDDDADDAHVGGTDALSWELMLSLRTENKQQRPHHDDDGDHHDHQTIQIFIFRKYLNLFALKIIQWFHFPLAITCKRPIKAKTRPLGHKSGK